MKKQVQKIESENVFKESQVMAMLERMDGKIDLMVENYVSLNDKVESLDSRVESLDSRVESLDSKVGSLDSRVESLDNRVESLAIGQTRLRDELREFRVETKNNFSAVFEYLSKIDDELADIREELEKRKKTENIDKNWLEKFEQRLKKAEDQLRKQKLAAIK
ncbi:MAG: hypothetical protein ACD_56C00077G0007 [uncultured bacterium]|nr:MAG: hypothetical protein ACD_56C00077G0007 [uncultured bacterium]